MTTENKFSLESNVCIGIDGLWNWSHSVGKEKQAFLFSIYPRFSLVFGLRTSIIIPHKRMKRWF